MARKPDPTLDSEEMFEISTPEFGTHFVHARTIEEAVERFRRYVLETGLANSPGEYDIDSAKHFGQVIFPVASPSTAGGGVQGAPGKRKRR